MDRYSMAAPRYCCETMVSSANLKNNYYLECRTYTRSSVIDYCATWIKAYEAREAGNKEETLKLVRKATAGFAATADLPPSDFMPEMMELYPDAKVVLVKRDPQKWWDSIATLTARTTPFWLAAVVAPIPGWRFIPTFASVYSRSTLRLAGINKKDASPTDLIDKGGPRRFISSSAFWQLLTPPCRYPNQPQ